MKKTSGLFLILFFSFFLLKAEMRSSVSQYGITWYFDKDYECGQFITGDWWVVGPVVVTHTDPMQTPGRNGSVLNVTPGSAHGWDDRARNYDENVRVTFPLSVSGISSLSTTISINTKNCTDAADREGYVSRFGICSITNTQTFAVLTIVDNVVPEGSFRPSYIGVNHKEILNISQVDFNVLPHLPELTATTDIDLLIDFIERPWMDHFNGWTTQYNFAADNNRGYGRDMSDQISEIAVALMQDIPEVDQLATLMIQRGIDIYQGVLNGAKYPGDGGHGSSRKWPVLFAGKLLNHEGMLNVGYDYLAGSNVFQEDCQTYYTTDGHPWWGVRHCSSPERDGEALDSYRICCTAKTWVGQMLTAMMLGLRDNWNHEAYFDYVDRWVDEGGGFGGLSDEYVEELWNTYRNNLPVEILHFDEGNPDIEAPSDPSNLSVIGTTGSSVNIQWIASTDNVAVTFYHVFLDDTLVQTVNGSLTNAFITGLECNTSYKFNVQARDGRGNLSNMSLPLEATTSQFCNPVNIAIGKNVIASSEDAPTPVTNLVDGDVSDEARWSALGFPQSAEIDLGTNYNLTHVELFTYLGRAYQYTIEAKEEGGEYEEIVDRSLNTSTEQPISDVTLITARYVKIIITGASGYSGDWVSLNELKIYENVESIVSTGFFENTSENNISIFPNPTNGLININLESEYSEIKLTVSDISGRIIEENIYVRTKNISFNLEDKPNGIYMLEVSTKQDKMIFKIIKK